MFTETFVEPGERIIENGGEVLLRIQALRRFGRQILVEGGGQEKRAYSHLKKPWPDNTTKVNTIFQSTDIKRRKFFPEEPQPSLE